MKTFKLLIFTLVFFSATSYAQLLIFKMINDDSVVNAIFKVAGYTYGPLLGLFAFGLLTQRKLKDSAVPYICLITPFICYFLDRNSMTWFNYAIGFELIVVNGFITFILLQFVSRKSMESTRI